MNPNVKSAWLAELRSGKKQGRSLLRKGDEYCCLGLLCELAVEAGVTIRREPGEVDGFGAGYVYGIDDEANTALLPREVSEWAGLDGISPEVTLDKDESPSDGFTGIHALTALNDNGVSFSEIADIIERKL